tara:strand:- start:777 stop:977 length:201 start_codon:yes stop_codon:yes gene_type:complete
MSCLYLSNSIGEDSGKCHMYDPDFEQPGCDDEGFCMVSDDPDPTMLCADFEPIIGWEEWEEEQEGN